MKGKYASKALNRAAAVDNEVIADLREKLQAERNQRINLESALNSLNKAESGELMREAQRIADSEIDRLKFELDRLRDAHRNHLDQLALDLLDLYAEHGCQVGKDGDVDRFNTEFAHLFGMAERFGELIDYMDQFRAAAEGREPWSEELNRRARRMTSTNKKTRRVDAMLTDMQRNPGKFGVGIKPGQRLSYGRARGPRAGEVPR